ncbi:MAG: OmpA family protein, partial [Bizionia sp.]|nr:OmpA family protein [Bizionia sp.]
DRINQEIVGGKIAIFSVETDEELYSFKTDKNGAFRFNSNCREDYYRVEASKEGYESASLIYIIESNNNDDITLAFSLIPQFPLVKEDAAPVGTDLTQLLDLDPIYFDFDKFNIRPDAKKELEKVVRYLKAHPSVNLDVRSHTDSRGSEIYNMALSDRRNVATKQWIIKNGNISSNRISGKGYGESQLVNSCTNAAECGEKEHQENRRSMFIISSN